jgi:hypothetical protein
MVLAESVLRCGADVLELCMRRGCWTRDAETLEASGSLYRPN